MPGARQKYNFYAVTNGREAGVYTNWPQAGDAVIGFAKAKYKGFITYSEARNAMEIAGIQEYKIYDGQNTFSRRDFEESLECHNITMDHVSAIKTPEKEQTIKTFEPVSCPKQNKTCSVFIEGSCIGNGSNSAKAGFGLFWGTKSSME